LTENEYALIQGVLYKIAGTYGLYGAPKGVIAYISKQDGQVNVMMADVNGDPPISVTQDGAEKNSPAW
jgi:hypothetical protein